MGILLICVVLIGIGIWGFMNDFEILALTGLSAGIVGLAICIITILFVQLDVESVIIERQQNMSYFETACQNEYVSFSERDVLVQLVLEHNSSIQSSKYYSHNFWTNWFDSKRVGDLPLLDITKIPPADTKATIVVEQ